MPLRNLSVIVFAAFFSMACYFKVERNRYAATVAGAMDLVSQYYVEDVDKRQLFEDAMAGMVSKLDDYSAFISPEDLKQMNASLDQEFGGLGVEVEKQEPDQPITVLSPLVGTPAYRAGIQSGDKILEVDGIDLIGMTLRESVKYMRGKPGAKAVLLIERETEDEPFEVRVVREVITVDSVLGDTRNADGSWNFELEANRRIAYLRVVTFGQHTVDEISRTLQDTEYEAILIDLRGNAGGLLDAAVGTCRLFVDEGRIVSTNGRHGQLRSSFEATGNSIVPKDVPIAMLVNRYSASASEIVAACLQDHGRAVVVGERTYGKGTVQNILELEGGRSALKLTTATYWRPSGKNIHRLDDAGEDGDWGVRPDKGFEVELSDEEAEKVFEARRARDRYRQVESEPGEGEPAGEKTTEGDPSADAPIDDPQWRRAVDYLEERLLEQDAQSQTASGRRGELLQLGVKA